MGDLFVPVVGRYWRGGPGDGSGRSDHLPGLHVRYGIRATGQPHRLHGCPLQTEVTSPMLGLIRLSTTIDRYISSLTFCYISADIFVE